MGLVSAMSSGVETPAIYGVESVILSVTDATEEPQTKTVFYASRTHIDH